MRGTIIDKQVLTGGSSCTQDVDKAIDLMRTALELLDAEGFPLAAIHLNKAIEAVQEDLSVQIGPSQSDSL